MDRLPIGLACSWLAPLALLVATSCHAQSPSAGTGERCGEVGRIDTRAGSTTRYSFVPPPQAGAPGQAVTLLLLAGGPGHVDLDDHGCARALKGNSLVR